MHARSEQPDPGIETARKWLHLAPGGLALALPFIGTGGAVVLCIGLVGFNLWVLPRFGGTRLWRPAELADGEAWAILFYPVALLILAVAVGSRLEILAGAWAMLAFGDAAATLVGRRWGRRPLLWHPQKSWLGSLAFVAASWSSVMLLVAWTAPETYPAATIMWAGAVAALVGAVVESLPWALDDNLSVTLVGGGALFVALEMASSGLAVPGLGGFAGILAVIALAVLARVSGALDGAGAVAGALLALAILLGGGWRALVLLGLFVLTGTLVGRWRTRRRTRHESTPRGVANVLANGAVASVCGLAMLAGVGEWALLACSGALATAMADTVGGEVGQALGGATRRLSDGEPVPPGANGGVSWLGTVATVVAAMLLAGVGLAIHLLDARQTCVVAAAGVAGAMMDSLLGATFERRGLLDNESTNLLSTLWGAWLAAQAGHFWL